jgi:hypothetical protein
MLMLSLPPPWLPLLLLPPPLVIALLLLLPLLLHLLLLLFPSPGGALRLRLCASVCLSIRIRGSYNKFFMSQNSNTAVAEMFVKVINLLRDARHDIMAFFFRDRKVTIPPEELKVDD